LGEEGFSGNPWTLSASLVAENPIGWIVRGIEGVRFFCLYCCKTEGIFDLGDKFFPTVTRNVAGWLEPCKRKNAKKWNFLSGLNFRSTF